MEKLNFGCGSRACPGWTNIDFHSNDPTVRRVDLLAGFPFPDDHFDIVYSSHVIEHFTREQGLFLIREARRVLKPGGIIRVVVPDLEESCKEYLRILDMSDADPSKRGIYDYIMIELLDQLVRTTPGGKLGPLIKNILQSGNEQFIAYVRGRTGSQLWSINNRSSSVIDRMRQITSGNLSTGMTYLYLKVISGLIPKNLRSMVFLETSIGERHRWMYDRYGIRKLFEEATFYNGIILRFDQSGIPNFNEYCLDVNVDGTSYKRNSIYFEARK